MRRRTAGPKLGAEAGDVLVVGVEQGDVVPMTREKRHLGAHDVVFAAGIAGTSCGGGGSAWPESATRIPDHDCASSQHSSRRPSPSSRSSIATCLTIAARSTRPCVASLTTAASSSGSIYGEPRSADATKRDAVEIPWGVRVHNRVWRVGGREVYWQPCLDELRDADLVIVEQATKLLLNYAVAGRGSSSTARRWPSGATATTCSCTAPARPGRRSSAACPGTSTGGSHTTTSASRVVRELGLPAGAHHVREQRHRHQRAARGGGRGAGRRARRGPARASA